MANKADETKSGEQRTFVVFIVSFGIAIVLCFAGIFLGIGLSNKDIVGDTLLARARSLFQEITVARSWNASYGGVYVVKRPGVESNPYLAMPDVQAVDGRKLTLRNPAAMTREISEFAAKEADFRFHITSLRPINPDNAPDAFERASLESFEGGATEKWATAQDGSDTAFRYIGALKVEESCLQCHAAQGYKVGQVRGGISVSFSIAAIADRQRREGLIVAASGAVACIALILAFLLFARVMKRRLDAARSELQEAAVHDALTGLFNRRFTLERTEEEFSKAKRSSSPFAIAILDVDDFKEVNDKQGHLVGDAALRNLASLIREGLRSYDVLGRYGGEEFLIILPETPPVEAMHVCERLRASVEQELQPRTPELYRRVTVSIGLATLDTSSDRLTQLFERADAALERAKAEGKNRCLS